MSIACAFPRSLNPKFVASASGATEKEFNESKLPDAIAKTHPLFSPDLAYVVHRIVVKSQSIKNKSLFFDHLRRGLAHIPGREQGGVPAIAAGHTNDEIFQVVDNRDNEVRFVFFVFVGPFTENPLKTACPFAHRHAGVLE